MLLLLLESVMMVGGGVFGVTEPGGNVVLDEVVSAGAGGGVGGFGHGELSFPGPRYLKCGTGLKAL